jgi:hypothetical protein
MLTWIVSIALAAITSPYFSMGLHTARRTISSSVVAPTLGIANSTGYPLFILTVTFSLIPLDWSRGA